MTAQRGPIEDQDLDRLLEAIYLRLRYDFRGYARASLRRRVGVAMARAGCATVSDLLERTACDEAALSVLLEALTVQVTELFRDPEYFRHFRAKIVPTLRTYPFVRLWVAGCSSGEEAYSFAIVLREEEMLERSLVYATDISAPALARAQAGVYPVARAAAFSESYVRAGGAGSLSQHYTAAYGRIVMDRALRERIVFSDHSLATDNVFAEVQLVSCRNVLIYFDRELQRRAVGLVRDALSVRGYLGLGARESLHGGLDADGFTPLAPEVRWYQRR